MLTCFYLSVILYFIHTLIIRLLFPMEPLLNLFLIFKKNIHVLDEIDLPVRKRLLGFHIDLFPIFVLSFFQVEIIQFLFGSRFLIQLLYAIIVTEYMYLSESGNWDKILGINIRLQDRKLKIDLESVKIFKQYCTATLYLMRR